MKRREPKPLRRNGYAATGIIRSSDSDPNRRHARKDRTFQPPHGARMADSPEYPCRRLLSSLVFGTKHPERD